MFQENKEIGSTVFENHKMSYQHGSNSYIPLLSASHARSSFVCFIDSSNNEDIEDDHNEAGNDSHEYEIGDQNVILNVSGVGS